MKKAILFGASGFVGSFLLEELLNNNNYEKVIIVVRKSLPVNHHKLETLIGDFRSLPDLRTKLFADDIFIALGTTQKKTPHKVEYYQTDHDYPVLAATIVKQNGAQSLFLVSAVRANEKSGIFYIRTKGKTEQDIIDLHFKHTHIFRPSMIMGSRNEKRPLEKTLIKLWAFINPLLAGGGLNKYRGIQAKDIAIAMNNSAKVQLNKVKIYHWKDMRSLL